MQYNFLNNQKSLFQKIKNFDYILILCILLLGFISSLSMYSTDGGSLLFHSKSHVAKFLIFFPMMIFLSFFNIKFWHFFIFFLYNCFSVFNLGFVIWN